MTQLAKISHIAFANVTVRVSGFYFKGLNTHTYEFGDVETNRPEHQSIRLMIVLVTFYFLNSSENVSVDGTFVSGSGECRAYPVWSRDRSTASFPIGSVRHQRGGHVYRAEPSCVFRLRLQHPTGEAGFIKCETMYLWKVVHFDLFQSF